MSNNETVTRAEGISSLKSPAFADAKLEREFVSFIAVSSVARVEKTLSVMSKLFPCYAGISFVGSNLLAGTYTPGSLVGVCTFIIWGIIFKLTLTHLKVHYKWYMEGNRWETLIVAIISTVTANLCITSADTYSHSYDIIFSSEEPMEVKRAVMVRWFMFAIVMTSIPLIASLVGLWIGGLNYTKWKWVLGGIFPSHAIRSLVLTPIPSGLFPFWCGFFYLTLPWMFWKVIHEHEIGKRENFLAQYGLANENANLEQKLHAAERALAFDKPTKDEQSVVDKVFSSDAAGYKLALLKQYEVKFSDLELHERVGAGSFGEVIRATYQGTECAAKRLLRSRMTERHVTHLREEALLLGRLRHPNIVLFIGVTWDSVANLCILFEFVRRGCLTDALNDGQLYLDWPTTKLRMAIDVARGVTYLHSRKPPIIHRDLKPDNVLVTTTFTCKVTDFGHSKEQRDVSMTVAGTVVYMAPEVYKGQRCTVKADVYSFALTLWHLHTGEIPFRRAGLTPNQILNNVSSLGMRPPLDDSFPGPLCNLIQRCWSQDPQDRPSMKEVVSQLSAPSMINAMLVQETTTSRVDSRTHSTTEDFRHDSVGSGLVLTPPSSVYRRGFDEALTEAVEEDKEGEGEGEERNDLARPRVMADRKRDSGGARGRGNDEGDNDRRLILYTLS